MYRRQKSKLQLRSVFPNADNYVGEARYPNRDLVPPRAVFPNMSDASPRVSRGVSPRLPRGCFKAKCSVRRRGCFDMNRR